jgi:hypothetical protein
MRQGGRRDWQTAVGRPSRRTCCVLLIVFDSAFHAAVLTRSRQMSWMAVCVPERNAPARCIFRNYRNPSIPYGRLTPWSNRLGALSMRPLGHLISGAGLQCQLGALVPGDVVTATRIDPRA